MFEQVASVFEDFSLNEHEAKAICDRVFIDDATLKAILYFPFFFKQKLLVTACKHPMKKLFYDSEGEPLEIPAVDAFAINDKVYPTIYDKSYAEDELNDIINGILIRYLMKTSMSPDCITPGPSSDGLSNYGSIDDKYMDACCVASNILQSKVFSKLGQLYVKSMTGIREKLVFRQKPVNDMLRVTIYYDVKSGWIDEHKNLLLKISEVKRKLESNRLTFIKEEKSGNGKPKLVYSLTLSWMDVRYPIWLEIQFSNEHVIGIHFNDHIDYELKRLNRGDMTVREMMNSFPNKYKEYQCVEDEDYEDCNIIMRMLGWEEIITG
jgi:hypothetical protein